MKNFSRNLQFAGAAALVGTLSLSAGAQATAGIQHIRPNDKTGLNVFETSKTDTVRFNGLKLSFGAAFTQQYQSLSHENTATPNIVNNVDLNMPIELGSGFNNANANFYMNAQLAQGIRVALTSYLSSRHHNETWVKDGYLQIDDSPLQSQFLSDLMEYVTLRVGHFEINYGDAHFRRTDNGNAMFNPFVGNLIMDAFTTEVGAEVSVRPTDNLLFMVGSTNGEIRGNVTRPKDRAPSLIGKVAYDNEVGENIRLRLSGSIYHTDRSISNTLYGGDRAGSRYYWVLENANATESGNFTSGRVNPGLRSKVTAMMFNPFVKISGLELFGTFEKASGRAANETAEREWSQMAAEAVYRFGSNENLYIGGRYNTVDGPLATSLVEVDVSRTQLGGGWFITNNLQMKLEYVNQEYGGFPASDIRSGGKFKGFTLEGIVVF